METLSTWSKVIIAFIVLILMYTKHIGTHFRMVNTFFHETSHAFIALIFGNKVKEINFNIDQSGSCWSISKNKFASFMTSIAGYTGCSLISLALVYAIEHRGVEISFLVIAIVALITLLLYMRKTYPLVWTMGFIAVNIICYMTPMTLEIKTYILYSIMILLLLNNTISCFHLLYIAFVNPKQSGDCALLKKITHIPSFLWALSFNLINLFIVYKISLKILF